MCIRMHGPENVKMAFHTKALHLWCIVIQNFTTVSYNNDIVCAEQHFNICKETGAQLDKKHWYEHVPKSVETSRGGKVTILWNQQVQTDRTISNNKPDIIIRDNEKGTCM